MRLQLYDNAGSFCNDTLDILIRDEVQNNLPISLVTGSKIDSAPNRMLATVSDNTGIVLTAIYIKPFNLLLYETENRPCGEAVDLLARELRRFCCTPLGVMAEKSLARRFSAIWSRTDKFSLHMPVTVMRLDKPPVGYKKAPGFYRLLEARDMSFAPFWERAFSEDCRTPMFSIPQNIERLKTRLNKSTHFIWEDGVPVSQAVHGRDTPNGAVIAGVYTPPRFRGHGYATSVVAELSGALLGQGKGFCCLLADAANPVSTGIYRKLGYYEVCSLEDIRFDYTVATAHSR